MTSDDPSADDLLDTALETLRDTPVPAGPSDELLTNLVASLQTEEAAGPVRPQSLLGRVYSMKPMMKFVVAVTLLVASIGVFDWLSVGGRALAFDEVVRSLELIQSASCQMTTESRGMVTEGRVLFLAPSLERVEMSVADQVMSITICDQQAEKWLSLLPQQKMAVVYKMENAPENRPANGSFEQVRERFRQARADGDGGARALGEKEIDGVRAVGFRLPDRTGSTDVWASAETALPVRVETTVVGEQTVKVVMTDFQYDIELDRSQFSFDPPAGYTVRESTIDASAPSIEDLRDMLKFCADNNDGVFPDELVGAKGVQSVIQKLMKEVATRHEPNSKEWQDAMMEYSTRIARGTAFVTFEQPKSRWHYAGGGVKLGEADQAIFWCRDQDAETWQVLFGDLTIQQDVAEADLPKSAESTR